ncbi:GntR family transcriptional regulator [Asanoa sp. WMMD1127]|uniref:GntR family transcriptional regulator n=1 Tax=Asanoa sp. WMMD1127 TaxID=3016107 RepID=UPI002417EC0A|nr:GntR family transcriptional regulator [Asanoa sp. WMMD1127]MDG4826000.1 GntR family transcriptional regulator [Asanoa sp. WMMD1127]
MAEREIREDDPRPVYRQLADYLREDIEEGRLQPGVRIPSETTLTQTYGVARETARKAVAVLRDAGLIETTHGRGSFVKRG